MDETEEVVYAFDELDEITHAYAVTVHRSQGSEYPCVVLPLGTSAWLMLRRNLLYTAVTRAKRLVVLVGSKRAIARAVRTEGAGRRYAALAERLRRGQRHEPGQRTTPASATSQACGSAAAPTPARCAAPAAPTARPPARRRCSALAGHPRRSSGPR
jgi:ATP-dependent exoDNAse (exonuclease V) beta subunit